MGTCKRLGMLIKHRLYNGCLWSAFMRCSNQYFFTILWYCCNFDFFFLNIFMFFSVNWYIIITIHVQVTKKIYFHACKIKQFGHPTRNWNCRLPSDLSYQLLAHKNNDIGILGHFHFQSSLVFQTNQFLPLNIHIQIEHYVFIFSWFSLVFLSRN